METNITKELLHNYYVKLSKKEDFGVFLSDDFLLTGTIIKESKGKEEYIKTISLERAYFQKSIS